MTGITQTLDEFRSCARGDAATVYATSSPPCDGFHLPPSRMSSPRIAGAPAMEPGVWVREINGHNVFLGIRQDGTPLPGIAVPLNDQTDDDVIVALADVVCPPSRHLRLVAGGLSGPASSVGASAYLPPRVALRLEPVPPRSPHR